MFRGYLHDEEHYRACFAGGWYLSGDLARVDEDGYYWFVGRADDVIKSAGHLIGPFEVESALMEHPAVAEVGVIGKPDPVVGAVVKAFVSLRSGYTPDDELRDDPAGLRPAPPGQRRPAGGGVRPAPAAHQQRQGDAPAAQGARARAARGRPVHAGAAVTPRRADPRAATAGAAATAATRGRRTGAGRRARRPPAGAAAADAADPPVRGDAAPRLYSAETRIRGFLHLYVGEEAVAAGVMSGARGPRTPSSRPTASTGTRWPAACRWTR